MSDSKQTDKVPDNRGFFGEYGGRFVPPQLESVLKEVEDAYLAARNDPKFWEEYRELLKNYVGRPSPL